MLKTFMLSYTRQKLDSPGLSGLILHAPQSTTATAPPPPSAPCHAGVLTDRLPQYHRLNCAIPPLGVGAGCKAGGGKGLRDLH